MFSKLYLDTAPLIYFLEDHPRYALKIQSVIEENLSKNCKFATSVITNVEYLPKPMQESKDDLVFAYNALRGTASRIRLTSSAERSHSSRSSTLSCRTGALRLLPFAKHCNLQ